MQATGDKIRIADAHMYEEMVSNRHTRRYNPDLALHVVLCYQMGIFTFTVLLPRRPSQLTNSEFSLKRVQITSQIIMPVPIKGCKQKQRQYLAHLDSLLLTQICDPCWDTIPVEYVYDPQDEFFHLR